VQYLVDHVRGKLGFGGSQYQLPFHTNRNRVALTDNNMCPYIFGQDDMEVRFNNRICHFEPLKESYTIGKGFQRALLAIS